MSIVIAAEHVSKTYRLGTIGGGTLRDDFSRWCAALRGKPDPLAQVGEANHARLVGHEFRALDDVNFQVRQGEVLGIIGRNGAGKSTLLKVLSQITAPTTGEVKVRGRIASLLEVGTGFHPELSGRENIFLNGAILGMTKGEIRSKLDEIIDFAGVEEFIDTPVKRYSSGMYVRLAFAVAAHLEPEILIVDEVLAVGDAAFQKKCLGKIGQVAKGGRTIVFVSHNMAAMAALCTNVILLDAGKLVLRDRPAIAIEAYQARTFQRATSPDLSHAERYGTGKGRFTSIKIVPLDKRLAPQRTLVPGGALKVEVRIQACSTITEANVALVVSDAYGSRLIDANTALAGEFLSLREGERATVHFHLQDVLLKPGKYGLTLWLGRGATEDIDGIADAAQIVVEADPQSAQHVETFPGIYQCRFQHKIIVDRKSSATGPKHCEDVSQIAV